jgi:hypothetical protein
MKKIVCLVVVVLMIAGVAIAAKKMAITAKDLPALKGTWEGTLGFGIMDQGGSSPVKLEILNDSVPVKARLTVSNVPTAVAMQFGDSGGQKIVEFDNGKITSQGTIMWIGAAPENFFEVSLSGEKKLGAWYYFRGIKGDGTLKKK